MASYALSGLVVATWLSGCEPELIVGAWSKPVTGGSSSIGGMGGTEAGSGAGGNGGVANAGTANGGAANAGASTGLGGTTGGTDAGSAGDTGGDGSGGDIAGGAGEAGSGGCDPGAPPISPVMEPITVPWETGFENGICDYVESRGFCYTNGDASYEIVAAPAHLGSSAAAFTVNASEGAAQTRCVRQGILPPDAYYGAWFYVPTSATRAALWNLFLIQGDNGEEMEPLWDVSLGSTDGGGQALFVFDHRGGEVLEASEEVEIPIGTWFHVEFRLLRAADAAGLVALYQDGVLLLETRRATDDTSWGQWYVGNLADGRSPPDSTVYVDDVSIRAAP